MQKSNSQILQTCASGGFEFRVFLIRICFGFRYSDFGFGCGFAALSSWQFTRCRRGNEAAAFHDVDQAVHTDVSDSIDSAADPVHPDLVNGAVLAQAKL